VAAGATCSVSCAAGYTGPSAATYTCSATNTDANTKPDGHVPICSPIAGCRPLVSQVSKYDLSDCIQLRAGVSCRVSCSAGFVGAATTFTCPLQLYNENTLPVAVTAWPSCVSIVPCAALSVAAQYYGGACPGKLSAGSSCTISCASAHVGGATEFRCPAGNTNATTAPTGAWPSCATIVPCQALQGLPARFDVTACANVAAGDTCTVTCAAGYIGDDTLYGCQRNNINSMTLPISISGIHPRCSPIVSCASVVGFGTAFDFSNCTLGQAGISAGTTCTARCGPTHVGGTSIYSCASTNTVPTQPPTGTLPVCMPKRACATLQAQGAPYDVTACVNVGAGDTCVVSCAPGYVGTTSTYICPAQNTIAATQPSGVPPICAAIVGCVALPDATSVDSLGPAFDTANCQSVAAGATCTVGCATGYTGTATSFICPANNTNPANQPTGTLPTCNVVAIGCAALSNAGLAYDVSACASVANGASCTVRCAAGYFGGSSVYTCPPGNTNPATQPGTMTGSPACSPLVACASLGIQGASYNVGACANVQAGSSCKVNCAPGYVGTASTFSCLAQNTAASTQLTGTSPACAQVVGCAALGSLGRAYNTTACVAVAAGNSCSVKCAAGHVGSTLSFSCPSDNTNSETKPFAALWPSLTCSPIVACAGLSSDGDQYNMHSCSRGISAGATCMVHCAAGYLGSSTTFQCPRKNINPDLPPRGSLPSCVAVAPCAALPKVSQYSVSRCNKVAAGDNCTVTCASGYTSGAAKQFSTFTCPSNNVNAIAPVGNLHQCHPVVGCATRSAPSTKFDLSRCRGLAAGETCQASCAVGYVGEPSLLICPTFNANPQAAPIGALPVCAQIVGCAPAPSVAGIDLSSCSHVAAGQTCPVTCNDNYRLAPTVPSYRSTQGSTWTWTCPAQNTDAQRPPSGLPPPCRAIHRCASLQLQKQYRSNCVSVTAGGRCSVECADRWLKLAWWIDRTSAFRCPVGNLDAAMQPHGILPVCDFMPVEHVAVVATLLVVSGLATWAVIVIISGSSCCCAVSTGVAVKKVKKTQWYRSRFHPDDAVQKEIDEAERAWLATTIKAEQVEDMQKKLDKAKKQAGICACLNSKVRTAKRNLAQLEREMAVSQTTAEREEAEAKDAIGATKTISRSRTPPGRDPLQTHRLDSVHEGVPGTDRRPPVVKGKIVQLHV
jgi:hypothetical protein